MGVEIQKTHFTETDSIEFQKNLRNETKQLMKWFEQEHFEDVSVPKCGLEVEAWLCDENLIPLPECEQFINKVNHKDVVPEISKFNFELNVPPALVENNVISQMHNNLKKMWNQCAKKAEDNNWRAFMIGSLPTIRNHMLTLDNLYPNKRYFALNEQILHFRKQEPITIEIEGDEYLKVTHKDVMLEAAATSVQVHLQVPLHKSVQYYNASLLASPFMAALGANSPFLFGKSLWQESRIPIFEQSISLESFPRLSGRKARRVTLGSGYLKKSLFELFLENLDGYPPLLPLCYQDSPEQLKHLCLHNGTIWRWNRPIIGLNEQGQPHLRLEHRVPSSGPTPIDIIGNMFAYIGMVSYFVEEYADFTDQLPFEELRTLFYASCKDGLAVKYKWVDGKIRSLQEHLHDEILPKSLNSLVKMGVNAKEAQELFNNVLKPRVLNGQNGSSWQKAFIDTHGKRFQEMLESYYQNQMLDKPIHSWQT